MNSDVYLFRVSLEMEDESPYISSYVSLPKGLTAAQVQEAYERWREGKLGGEWTKQERN